VNSKRRIERKKTSSSNIYIHPIKIWDTVSMLKEVKGKSISKIMRKKIKQIESNRYAY